MWQGKVLLFDVCFVDDFMNVFCWKMFGICVVIDGIGRNCGC